MYDDIMGDEILGDELVGDDILGDEVEGEELVGEDLLGDDLLGEEVYGDDILGDALVGAWRRRRRRRRGAPPAQQPQQPQQSMAQRALMARRLRSAKAVTQRPYSKGRVQSFGFTALGVQPNGGTVDIAVRPQTLFRGRRLIVPGAIAPSFVIEDIKVGRNSQFVADGGQPAEAFKETATGDNLSLDTCQPGMDIVLKVRNTSAAALDFRAALFGDVVE